MQIPTGAITEEQWGEQGTEDRNRNQTQPVDQSLRQFFVRQIKQWQGAGQVGYSAHSAEKQEVVVEIQLCLLLRCSKNPKVAAQIEAPTMYESPGISRYQHTEISAARRPVMT